MSELNVSIPTHTLSFLNLSTAQQCQQILQQKQFKETYSSACLIFSTISSLVSIVQNRSAIFPETFQSMARKKKQQKKKKRKKSHKGRGFFSDNAYNTYLYDHLKHGRKRQRGGFLNRYDFAYAGRDTVNQASKHLNVLAPKLVDQITNRAKTGLDKISATRIEQIKQIAPGLIKGAVEELYKTPFRLLGNMGKKKYNVLKKRYLINLKN